MVVGSDVVADVIKRLTIDEEIRSYEARVIVSDTTGVEFSDVLRETFELTERMGKNIDDIIEERNSGRPLAYVLKSVAFRDLDLYVDERVLIPRPETELVVEHCLEVIKDIAEPNVLDVGTGSGVIALSIAHEHQGSHVLAVDLSADALVVAQMNCAAVGSSAARVRFMQSDLFQSLDRTLEKSLDLIVSNPPYGSEDEKPSMSYEVLDFEPHNAIFSDDNGFSHIEKIIREAPKWLKPQGALIIEMAPQHGERFVAAASNSFSSAEVLKDMTGRDRIGVARL